MAFAPPLVKTPDEIRRIERAAALLDGALKLAESLIAPGVRAKKIDDALDRYLLANGGTAANREIAGYGYASSISVGNEIAHGKPVASKILKAGDAVTIDLAVNYEGCYADMARTYGVGEVRRETSALIHTCHKALLAGIAALRPGAPLSVYGARVEAASRPFAIAKTLAGHGVGRAYHEPPKILNFFHHDNDYPLADGMTLAFELALLDAASPVTVNDDGMIVAREGIVAAHFEYTVLIEHGRGKILGVG